MVKRPEDNVWIETKAGDGKSYFYHSRTRETSWNRPENAIILTQEQFNSSIRQHMPPMQGTTPLFFILINILTLVLHPISGQRPMWPQNPLLGQNPLIPNTGQSFEQVFRY